MKQILVTVDTNQPLQNIRKAIICFVVLCQLQL